MCVDDIWLCISEFMCLDDIWSDDMLDRCSYVSLSGSCYLFIYGDAISLDDMICVHDKWDNMIHTASNHIVH